MWERREQRGKQREARQLRSLHALKLFDGRQRAQCRNWEASVAGCIPSSQKRMHAYASDGLLEGSGSISGEKEHTRTRHRDTDLMAT